MHRGLGALVAEKFASEGSNVVINYVSSVDRAREAAAKLEAEYQVKTSIIQGVRRQYNGVVDLPIP
jgi:NAD(P)-dependent dehydrogenase (short-subunit alcohol dehydrogenase family)